MEMNEDMQKEIDKVKRIFASLPYEGSEEEREECRALLWRHSRDVADLALEIAGRHPEQKIDMQFLEEAALLHDIGVAWTDAPGIHCHGTEPYIRHGQLGAEALLKLGLPRHARVAATHTGAGITAEEVVEQHLPLPVADHLPETIEEKLICYADKFFSKSHPERRKTMEQARRSLSKFGAETVERFEALAQLFGEVD